MKKAKENWIGELCCEMEENLRKNNSKSIPTGKRLDYSETRESDYCP